MVYRLVLALRSYLWRQACLSNQSHCVVCSLIHSVLYLFSPTASFSLRFVWMGVESNRKANNTPRGRKLTSLDPEVATPATVRARPGTTDTIPILASTNLAHWQPIG